jgi:hypothetical protein
MTANITRRGLSRLLILLVLLVAAQGMTAAQNGEPTYVTWTESNNRFAFDIPYGWVVDAYTFDLYGQTAPYVFVFEPQEHAVVIAGIPSSTLYLDSSAYTEGEQVTLDGFDMTVAPFQAPVDYLERYLRTEILNDSCNTIFIVQKADAEPTDEGSVAAQISLECHFDGGYANGFFYLQTMRTELDGVGLLWMPTDFYGYLAEPAFEAQAEAALMQMKTSFTISEQPEQPQQTTANTPINTSADTPVQPVQTNDSGYDPDAFLQAQRELYQQQQTTAMISNMLQMQHETNMTIINNIGGYDYEYEWVWVP